MSFLVVNSVLSMSAIRDLYFSLLLAAVFTLLVTVLNSRPSITCVCAGSGVFFSFGLKIICEVVPNVDQEFAKATCFTIFSALFDPTENVIYMRA